MDFDKFSYINTLIFINFLVKIDLLTYLIILQNPPELEAPLFETTDAEKDANKASNLDIEDLELSIF